MKILIGSTAAKQWFPDFPREPQDIDYITDEEASQYKGFKYIQDAMSFYKDNEVAFPHYLLTLKMSHIYFNIWYDKTIYDIIWYKNKGIEPDEVLLKILYKDWENKYGKKQISLNKSNEEFFKDNVRRKYEHDEIHKAIAFYDEPLYLRVKKDKTKAALSKELFDKLSQEDKLKLALEEINVVSLERWLIPSNFKIHPRSARYKACKQLIVSMSTGWFPRFLVDNFRFLYIENFDDNYVKKFKDYFNGY